METGRGGAGEFMWWTSDFSVMKLRPSFLPADASVYFSRRAWLNGISLVTFGIFN
jgi:hypothetical protein